MRPGTIRCASGGGDEGVPHAARTPGFVVVMAPPRKRRKYDANPSSDETFAPAKISQDTYPFEQEEETSIRQIIIPVGMGAFFALSVPIAQVIDLTTRLTSHHGRSRRGRSPDHAGQGRRYRYREHLRHRDQRGLETPWSRRCPYHVGLFRRTQNHDRCDRPGLESTRMAGFSLFAHQRPRSPLRRAFGMLVGHLPISMSIRPSAVTIRQPRISLAYPIDIRRS